MQPANGVSLLRPGPLGDRRPIETDYAPSGSSYVLNVELAGQDQPKNFTDTLGSTMELYRFRATALVPVATVGFASGLNLNAVGWDGLPPTYEDSTGDLYVAWQAHSGFDGCPSTPEGLSSDLTCLVYRRISSGGVPGPDVVLVTNTGAGGNVSGLGPIAVNSQGVGWMLDDGDNTSTNTSSLYAQPLVSAAAVTTPPVVAGSSVKVPGTCAGGPGSNCGLRARHANDLPGTRCASCQEDETARDRCLRT